MYEIGNIVDGKYHITGICSDKGGMGIIFYAESVLNLFEFPIVLKCCKTFDEVTKQRFRREVRLLTQFKGNSKIVQIIDANLDADVPYFVMKFYPQGDISSLKCQIDNDYKAQEALFFNLIDCIAELHMKAIYHRDIKPENFLIDEYSNIIVSDFGLLKEENSATCFTNTIDFAGTNGYIPPEFADGGIK